MPTDIQSSPPTEEQIMRGKKAEWFVRGVSEGLPKYWLSLGNIVLGNKGNIDQVIVSPTGVWAIEIKSHAGKITFDGNELLRNGEPLEKEDRKASLPCGPPPRMKGLAFDRVDACARQ